MYLSASWPDSLRLALVWGCLFVLAGQAKASDEPQGEGLFEKKPDVYGGVQIRPGRVTEKEPLLLGPAPSGVVVPAPDVEVRTIPQVDKDFYRVGIGIDVVRLVDQFRKKHPS